MSEEDRIERIDLQITQTLRGIEADYNAATESASRVLERSKAIASTLSSLNANLDVWRDFFQGFLTPPDIRATTPQRPPPPAAQTPAPVAASTPAPSTVAKPVSPASSLGSTPVLGSPPRTTTFITPYARKRAAPPAPDDNDTDLSSMATPTLTSPPKTPIMPPTTGRRRKSLRIATLKKTPSKIPTPRRTPALLFDATPTLSMHGLGRFEEASPHKFAVQSDQSDGEGDRSLRWGGGDDDEPTFDLAMFPPPLRRGLGALQITEVYSVFFGDRVTGGRGALSTDDVHALLPDYSPTLLEELAGALVEANLLVQIEVDGQKYWERPN